MEIWKDIENYNGYQISNFGRVKSLSKKVKCKNGFRITKEKILKTNKTKLGYCKIQLGKKSKCILVHRLVAVAFIENTLNKPHVNHINGIKDDNRLENLEWVTQSENQIHAYKIGLNPISFHERAKGVNCGASKLSELDVLSIRELYNGKNANELGKMFSVSGTSILNIKNKKTWKHI